MVVAAARKLGAQLGALDDIKLAVSEACNRAIAAAIRCELTDAVELSISRQRTSAGGEHIVLAVRDYAPYRYRYRYRFRMARDGDRCLHRTVRRIGERAAAPGRNDR
ncbi:MAG: ATP-binding protein [Mycobacteriales bacterium]